MRHLLPGTLFALMASIFAQDTVPTTHHEITGWGIATDPAGDCRFAVADQKLTITVPGTHHDLNPAAAFRSNMLAPRVLKRMDGNFAVHVTVDPLEHPKPNSSSSGGESRFSYVGAGLLIWKDQRNFARFERAVNGDSRNVFLQVEVFIDGEVVYRRGEVCEDKPVKLRIERTESSYTFSRSEDGKDWTRIARLPVPLTGPVQAGVMAINATTAGFAPVFSDLSTSTPDGVKAR